MHLRPLAALAQVSTLLLVLAACGHQPPVPEPLLMPVTFETVLALPSRPPDIQHSYGPSQSQRVLVWHPAADAPRPAPVVVLLHGGCWLSEYAVDHIYPLASALSASGFAVWAPEYRRLGEPGGGWPGTFEDVATAIDLLKDGTDPTLDVQRVALVGHSAGGHLALWAASRGAFSTSHPLYREGPLIPRGAIGLAAVTDLEATAAGAGACRQAAVQLMGGPYAGLEERYRQASPASLPRPVPVVLLHGPADAIVPPSQAQAIPEARLRSIEGAGHFDLIHPESPAFAVLLEELSRMLGDA